MAIRRLLVGGMSVLLLFSLAFSIKTPLVRASMQCREVYSVFARGSGQTLLDHEAKRFSDQLDIRLANVPHESLELGSQKYEGYQYPAVNVDPWAHTGTDLGAGLSGGYGGEYGRSVQEGVSELIYRVVNLRHDCPNSRIVLGGYSQGAQVMGQALRAFASESDKTILDHIDFAALFGDPKLDLPEGQGLFPPACDHKDFSPWRRKVPNCHTHKGSLGKRDPYLPSEMKDKVGLWCNDEDFVCGSSLLPWAIGGHGRYHTPDGPIDDAVLEIAKRIKESINEESINVVPDPLKIPEGHPDVVIVFDNSTENSAGFDQFVVPTVFTIADKVTQQGGRVGLQTYNGCARKGYTYFLPLDHNPARLKEQARTAWRFTPQCDLSQDLLNTLKHIKTSTGWRDGVNKMIVVVPKVPFSSTATAVSVLLNSQPDLHFYSIIPEETDDSYSQLKIDSYKNTPINLSNFNTILAENTTNPQLKADLSGANVITHPSTDLPFDASASIVYDDTITRYDWDWDGDNIIDQTTTMPLVHHTYTSEFNGHMNVTVNTASGLSDTASQDVLVKNHYSFTRPAKAPTLQLAKRSDSSVRLTWKPRDDLAIAWWLTMDDGPLGWADRNQHSLNITDIPLTKKHIFTVEAIMKDGTRGDIATISTTDRKGPSSNSTPKQEDIQPQATQVLGDKSQAASLSPAALAVSKLSPAAKTVIRSSLIFIIIASIVVSSVLGWRLYKNRKNLF